jgi:cytochrome c peroxidase
MAQLKHAFKTPTLRNISQTAPYMHNGVFKTLEEVVIFYNEGGGVGNGITVENQTLPSDKLNLSLAEQKALVAFMKTLSDNK